MSFELLFKKLENYHPLILQKPAILAYSGGIDSSFLVLFYKYLFENYSIPKPILFHLDHSIRDNHEQENEIQNFSTSLPFLSIHKKKKFRNYLKS